MAAIPKADVCAVRGSGYPYSDRDRLCSLEVSRRKDGLRDRVRLIRGGHHRGEVEKAGGAQLVDARQRGEGVQAEMGEKVRGRRPEKRAAGAGAPPPGADPAGLPQRVDRALAESHPADLFDLGAGHRLMIGDDGKGLDRRPRQLAGDPSLDPQSGGKIGCGAKRPAAGEADEVDAAPGIAFGELGKQFPDVGTLLEMPGQGRLVERFGRGEQQCLDEAQALRPLAHLRPPSPSDAGLRRKTGPKARSWRSSMRPSRTSSSAAAKVAASADRRNNSPRTSCGRKLVNSRQSGRWPRKRAKRFNASSIDWNAEGSMVNTGEPPGRLF